VPWKGATRGAAQRGAAVLRRIGGQAMGPRRRCGKRIHPGCPPAGGVAGIEKYAQRTPPGSTHAPYSPRPWASRRLVGFPELVRDRPCFISRAGRETLIPVVVGGVMAGQGGARAGPALRGCLPAGSSRPCVDAARRQFGVGWLNDGDGLRRPDLGGWIEFRGIPQRGVKLFLARFDSGPHGLS
jgi:hypothetical protein